MDKEMKEYLEKKRTELARVKEQLIGQLNQVAGQLVQIDEILNETYKGKEEGKKNAKSESSQ